MNNGKISLRQMRRMLFFDILGIGLVVMPEQMADYGGTAGFFSLLSGALLFLVYLFLLQRAMKRENRRAGVLYGVYGVYLLLAGGYGLFLLTGLMKKFLLEDKSFFLIAALLLLLVVYSKKGGLEGRARVYEILFWPMVVLLAILILLGIREAEPENLLPVMASTNGWIKGVYLSFLLCSAAQIVYFLPDCMENGATEKDMIKGVAGSVIWAVFILGVLYEILLGSFGKHALAAAETPIMIYTSNIIMPGGFLRRQEALIAAVCFAALLSFTESGFCYGTLCLKKIKNSPLMTWLAAGFVFAATTFQYYQPEKTEGIGKLLCYATPAALLLPFLLCINGVEKKAGNKKTAALILLLLSGVTFSGCSVQELENRSFPMVMSLAANDDMCELSYRFMDLSRVSGKEQNTQSGYPLKVTGSSVSAAIYEMDMQNGKAIDLNHLKVLLLEKSFLENEDLMRGLMEKGNSGVALSGNMLVFVTEKISDIEDLQKSMDDDLGSYLEELMEGNPNYKHTGGTTFKKLICDWYNGNGNTVLPELTVKDGLPVVEGYYLLQSEAHGKAYRIGKISEEQGLVANLCDGEANALDITIDGGRIHMENVSASYEFSKSNRYVLCRITISGDIVKSESTVKDEAYGKRKAKNYFSGEIQNMWSKYQIDLTNSYYHLRSHDKHIYEEYSGDFKEYCDDLQIEIVTNIRTVA